MLLFINFSISTLYCKFESPDNHLHTYNFKGMKGHRQIFIDCRAILLQISLLIIFACILVVISCNSGKMFKNENELIRPLKDTIWICAISLADGQHNGTAGEEQVERIRRITMETCNMSA